MGYTPLFSTLTTGTLCGRWPDIGLWPIVLSLTNWQGVVDVTPEYISSVTGLPITEVEACMARFCQPDGRSRSGAQQGARLELIDAHRDWGWRVVNIQLYRDRASGADQVEDGRNAEKVRKYKERHRRTPADTEGHSATPTHTSDSYSDKDLNPKNPSARKSAPEWFEDFKSIYPPRAGDSGWRKAQRAGSARMAEGHHAVEFLAGARRYAVFILATGKAGTEFVQQAATFLGPGKPFLQPWHPPPKAENPMDRLRRVNGLAGDHRGTTFDVEGSGAVGAIGRDVRR